MKGSSIFSSTLFYRLAAVLIACVNIYLIYALYSGYIKPIQKPQSISEVLFAITTIITALSFCCWLMDTATSWKWTWKSFFTLVLGGGVLMFVMNILFILEAPIRARKETVNDTYALDLSISAQLLKRLF